jgi:hypothetical protein
VKIGSGGFRRINSLPWLRGGRPADRIAGPGRATWHGSRDGFRPRRAFENEPRARGNARRGAAGARRCAGPPCHGLSPCPLTPGSNRKTTRTKCQGSDCGGMPQSRDRQDDAAFGLITNQVCTVPPVFIPIVCRHFAHICIKEHLSEKSIDLVCYYLPIADRAAAAGDGHSFKERADDDKT